jgi:hypothetical protein
LTNLEEVWQNIGEFKKIYEDKNSCANLIDWYKNTRNNTDATSVYACGGDVRLQGYPEAITCEAGKVDKQDLSSPSL